MAFITTNDMRFKDLAYQRKNIPLLLWLSFVIFYACSTTQEATLPFVPPPNFDASSYLNPESFGYKFSKFSFKKNETTDTSFVIASVKGGKKGIINLQQKVGYPEEARRNGDQGTVMLKLYVDSTGTLTNILPLKFPSALLAESAEKVFIKARYNAATLKGKKVNSFIIMPVLFGLFGHHDHTVNRHGFNHNKEYDF